jgi:hypothetical protein
MPKTEKTADPRSSYVVGILNAVKNPLGLYTLVVIAVLLTLLRTNDPWTKNILTGVLTAVVIVVFVLVLLPGTRNYFLGEPVSRFAAELTNLPLTGNDYRFIREISKSPNRPDSFYQQALEKALKRLGSDPPRRTLDQRVKALRENGYVQEQPSSGLLLTEKGRDLASVISTIATAFEPGLQA